MTVACKEASEVSPSPRHSHCHDSRARWVRNWLRLFELGLPTRSRFRIRVRPRLANWEADPWPDSGRTGQITCTGAGEWLRSHFISCTAVQLGIGRKGCVGGYTSTAGHCLVHVRIRYIHDCTIHVTHGNRGRRRLVLARLMMMAAATDAHREDMGAPPGSRSCSTMPTPPSLSAIQTFIAVTPLPRDRDVA